MQTYWIILILTLILTLIPTLNVPIYKFKYQSMICMINSADYHLPDHHVNIIQLSNSTHMYLHSYKINILIDNSIYTEYQKKP